jgi:alpha-L-rhamnosidase
VRKLHNGQAFIQRQVSVMEKRIVRLIAAFFACGVLMTSAALPASVIPKLKPKVPDAAPGTGSTELRVDDLKTPLGIDDPAPRFSWQLKDPARGAKQTAYQVEVASSEDGLGKPDVWDSGKITSGASLNVKYAGPEFKPGTRYFWRVKVWNLNGKPYPEAASSSWETGLLKQDGWHASWIGYETAEEAAVRHASAAWIASPDAKVLDDEKSSEQHTAYRQTVTLAKPVKSATLYATGQDTVSAWVNGGRVLTEEPLPPWKQMPWKKFQRADVTDKLRQGPNTIAIETVHYVANPDNAQNDMRADDCHAGGGVRRRHDCDLWKRHNVEDSHSRRRAGMRETSTTRAGRRRSPGPAGPRTAPLGHPWIPDSVKALRQSFEVKAPVKSARLYATALGAYELFLNGKRVGDDVLAPGWTDYREHVKYQTYDVTAQVVSGKNAIGALLAPGWYETPLEWFQQPNNYGDTPPALRAQLRIEHADGSVEWVAATDTSWKASTTDILHSEIYDGESQDARLKQTGWDTAAFEGAAWKSALPSIPSQSGLKRRTSAHPRGADSGTEGDDRAQARRVCLRLRPELFRR